MANFDELKQKAKDTMETIADRSVELYKIAEEKTKIFAKITKLSTDIALEKGNIRKLYREIGKRYYEMHKSSPEEALAQTCTEVTSAFECIAAKQKEIEELKKSYSSGEKETDEAEPEEKDAEVEIIIEEFDKSDREEEAASSSQTSGVSDINVDDDDDVIGKTPPEFKL